MNQLNQLLVLISQHFADTLDLNRMCTSPLEIREMNYSFVTYVLNYVEKRAKKSCVCLILSTCFAKVFTPPEAFRHVASPNYSIACYTSTNSCTEL